MSLRCALLSGILLLAPLAAAAQAPSATDDLAAVEEIPALPARLASQWNLNDMAQGTRGWLDDHRYFGRLRDLTAPEQLTLEDCVALAIANNTQLQLDRLGPLGARVRIRQSQSVFDPAVFASANLDRTRRESSSYREIVDATAEDGTPIPIDQIDTGALGFFLGPETTEQHRFNGNIGLRKLLITGAQMQAQWRNQRKGSNSPFQALYPEYTSELELSLNQPLLRDFGLNFTTLQVRIAENASQAAGRQYEAALSNLVKRVEMAYWLLVGTRENVSVTELGLQVANELLRQNEGKFNVGTVPRTSVLEARADVARREADLIQANKLHTNARDALRAILNVARPGTDSLVIVEPIDPPTVQQIPVDLDQSLQTALERRAELAAARLNLKGASMELKMAENQLLPRLDAVGLIGMNRLGGDSNRTTTPFDQPTASGDITTVNIVTQSPYGNSYGDTLKFKDDFYSYAAGLVLEIPLDNAAAKAQYQQTRIGAEQTRLSLRQLQEAVTAEVKKAINDAQADTKAIEATRLARELAEENVRNQQARFEVGLGTTKDLLDFQDQLTQARAEEVRALTQYRIDLAELRRVEGTLLRAHNVEIAQQPEESTPWWARF